MSASASVLVVDDDADVRTLVGELLTRAGYRISEAPDGRAALRVLYDERPDLVLLDVSMPELDGWGTLERIREVSDVPVVMLSALGAELEKVRALRGGADDYVTKPFGRQELLARADHHHRLHREVGNRAHALHDQEPTAAGEADVNHEQIRVLLARDRDRRDRVGREDRLEALLLQLQADQPSDVGVVLDDQDLSGHPDRLWRSAATLS
jgi:DNA-binding response OmpR family regulator